MNRDQKHLFIKELETVSTSLAQWAQYRLFAEDWSIEDVKVAIRNAMKVCEREE